MRIGCFVPLLAALGLVRVLPFLCCWSALAGRLSVLECALWGFLLFPALLHPFPLLRLFVTPPCVTSDRADILCVLQGRLLHVTHCCADTYVKMAATTAGTSAEACAAKKVAKYACRESGGYDFTPAWSSRMATNARPRIRS